MFPRLSVLFLSALFLCPSEAAAQVEGRACIPEPTDMAIAVDDVIVCAIDVVGDSDIFRFTAQPGEMFSMQATRHSGGEPQIEVFDPAGTRIAGPVVSGAFSQFARIDIRATVSGTHTIRVSDWGSDAPLNYLLAVNRVSSPSAALLQFGSRVNGEINPRGDVDLYTFTGAANDRILIQATRRGAGEPEIELLDAAGTRVAGSVNTGPFSQFVRLDYKLPATGSYTLRVTDWGSDAPLHYFLTLDRVGPASPSFLTIPFGTAVSGQVAPQGNSEFYTFHGSAGSTLTIQATRLSGGEPEIELFDAGGNRVAGPANTGPFSQIARIDTALTVTGAYSIRVTDWGSDAAAVGYRLEVQCIGACQQPPAPSAKGRFVPVTPCRIADTRLPGGPFGGPVLSAEETRFFAIPASNCQIPSNAVAYAMNVTVVPLEPLFFLTMWPSGQPRPLVSTLNSFDGAVVANAAIVPAGASAAVNVYATGQTHVILDINGYFVDPAVSANAYAFYPIAPCRIADTRNAVGDFGGPSIVGGQSRDFAIRASPCGLPPTALAYSLNVTAVPTGPLSFLTIWPAGQPRPLASTLNSFQGTVVANSAIVPAGSNGGVSVFVTDRADVALDINGYFAPPEAGGLQFHSVSPCRVSDTRNAAGPFGGPTMAPGTIREVNPQLSACGIPPNAQGYSTNVTVVPGEPLAFLRLWPAGQGQPGVSTLNSFGGKVVANAAIVPAGSNGAVSIFVTNRTDVILDINGFFEQ